MLDAETVQDMSPVELYEARGFLKGRMDALREQLKVVDAALLALAPLRFADTVMMRPSWKWTPHDKTLADVRNWCGDADTFLSIAHVSYVRVTDLAALAKERAKADEHPDPPAFAEGVVNGLGSKVPAGDYPSFVPITKAPKWALKLPDVLGAS